MLPLPCELCGELDQLQMLEFDDDNWGSRSGDSGGDWSSDDEEADE